MTPWIRRSTLWRNYDTLMNFGKYFQRNLRSITWTLSSFHCTSSSETNDNICLIEPKIKRCEGSLIGFCWSTLPFKFSETRKRWNYLYFWFASRWRLPRLPPIMSTLYSPEWNPEVEIKRCKDYVTLIFENHGQNWLTLEAQIRKVFGLKAHDGYGQGQSKTPL